MFQARYIGSVVTLFRRDDSDFATVILNRIDYHGSETVVTLLHRIGPVVVDMIHRTGSEIPQRIGSALEQPGKTEGYYSGPDLAL